MTEGFLTAAGEARAETVVQKSRFIACLFPAGAEEAVLDRIAGIREEFRGASHHCYAYILGKNAGITRHQDDGEPSGTAGLPILEALRGRHLVNVCAVVIRYFGGILLGRGGLTRAYGNACLAAVDAATIVRMRPTLRLSLPFDYSVWDRVRHRLGSLEVIVEDTVFDERVTAKLLVPEKDAGLLTNALQEILEAPVETGLAETLDYPWPAPERT